jgi:uncharacterized membrane protein YuzA (DUF378 family)
MRPAIAGRVSTNQLEKVVKALTWTALVLLVVGGLNWLLVGAFNFDLVATLFGEMSPLSRIVYVLVGVSAVYVLVYSRRLVSSA